MKQNKVEKLLAGVLSISLAMGVNVMPAFAAQVQGPPYEDMSRVYLTKNYELANTGTLILFQMDLIIFSPLLLTSEHPVCDRVCDPVQCRCIEFSGLFLVSSPRSLDDPFHLLRDNIGKRRKDQ